MITMTCLDNAYGDMNSASDTDINTLISVPTVI